MGPEGLGRGQIMAPVNGTPRQKASAPSVAGTTAAVETLNSLAAAWSSGHLAGSGRIPAKDRGNQWV